MKRVWTEQKLRKQKADSKESLRILIEEVVGLKHPATVFGQSFFNRVWARTPRRGFAEARISKASAFAKAAAAYVFYSK